MTDFNTIFYQHYPYLLHFSMKMTANREASEDIVMKIFVRYWKHMGKIEKGSVKAWLMISVKNESNNYLHWKERNDKKISGYADAFEDRQLPLTFDVVNYIHQEINNLPPQRREAMKLLIEGYSPEQISKIMGLANITVRNQLALARKTLRALFNDNQDKVGDYLKM